MKVFLIAQEPEPTFSYAEDTPAPAEPRAASSGVRGWVENRIERLKSSFRNPQGWLGRKLKQTWDWLQSRLHPDERLLAALRKADWLAVYHDRSRTSDGVQALWRGYLRRRRRRHLAWLAVDGLLTPLAVLLTPLPGPNLVGYWFAYRAVSHVLILLGIRRAQRGRLETTFHSMAYLEPGDRSLEPRRLSQGATPHEVERPCDC